MNYTKDDLEDAYNMGRKRGQNEYDEDTIDSDRFPLFEDWYSIYRNESPILKLRRRLESGKISDSMENWIKDNFNEEWIEIETDINFSDYEPIDISSSLHVIEYRYKINEEEYKLYYPIGDSNAEPLIQILK